MTRPLMPVTRLAPPIAAAILLAGCTFFGGESSDVDKTDYDGGAGFALAMANVGKDPFNVTVTVLGVGNAELARIQERLEPGDRFERWYSLESRSVFSARMSYQWNAQSGAASHGFDDKTFDANDCPAVTRLAWELDQMNNTVGHRFLGKTCVEDE